VTHSIGSEVVANDLSCGIDTPGKRIRGRRKIKASEISPNREKSM